MARKKSPPKQVEVAPRIESEGAVVPQVLPLSFEEREELKSLLAKPVMRKAWANAEVMKPSPFVDARELNGALGGRCANNRLHQIQGWELFKAAIVKQTIDPRPRPQPVRDEYPPDSFLGQSHDHVSQTSQK